MNEIPIRNDNLLFRTERDGTMMVVNDYIGIKFLNNTAAYIFNNINGTNTVEDIVNNLKNKYSFYSEQDLRQDVIECLYSFESMKFIKRNNCNNYLLDDIKIGLAGEGDFGNVSNFIAKCFKDTNNAYIKYLLTKNKNYYSDIAIRTRHFHLLEVFFVHRKSEEYNALISLMGLNSAGSPVNISFLAAKDMGVLIDTYKYVENVLKIYKKKKIKILLLEKEKETKILNFINSVGFFEEAFLKKENNNQDIYLYSKLLEMNSSD